MYGRLVDSLSIHYRAWRSLKNSLFKAGRQTESRVLGFKEAFSVEFRGRGVGFGAGG